MTARASLPKHLSDGPFLVSAALSSGVTRSRLTRADLRNPFWGVRTPARAPSDFPALCRAAKLRLSDDVVFSHTTAAQLLCLPLPTRLRNAIPMHVSAPSPRRAPTARHIVGHSVRVSPHEIFAVHGVRLTTPARTWLDLAGHLTLIELIVVGDHLIHERQPFLTIDQLTDASERYLGRRGRPLIRAALPLLRPGAESPKETEVRVILVIAGLPEPECNVDIFDSAGRFIARGDLVYRKYKVLLEYQGDYHRTDKAQWRHDLRRLARLQDEDWLVLQITADDLQNRTALVERIERHLRSRGWTGRRKPPTHLRAFDRPERS